MDEAAPGRPASSIPRKGRRDIPRKVAVAVLVSVVVVAGGVGFLVVDRFSGTSQHVTQCSPPPDRVDCGPPPNSNDVVLFVADPPAVGETMTTIHEGQSLPATVSLPDGQPASSFTVSWGDGVSTTQTSSTFSHIFHGIGVFVVSATAVVRGTSHSGTSFLFPVKVVPTIASTSSGRFPTLSTTFSNGSTGGPNYPWITEGGQVKVAASYSALPTAPGYTARAPTITSSGGNQVSNAGFPSSVAAAYSFSKPGQYMLTMVSPVTGPSGTDFQNYTWTVYVAAPGTPIGCDYCKPSGAIGPTSPHPGALYSHEIVPGGATSLDPAVDYETTGGEIIQNVYETLVQYDRNSTASFVPVLSTCVPGPSELGPTSCQVLYGNDLVSYDGVYWTFPIDANAKFYDPSTGASWGVYPSDVMFSIARTLMWLQTPSQYVTNGWIIGQSLLPFGQKTFDGGNHVPWNNTPKYVYGSMLVNDSQYCPATAMTNAHGCITFEASGSGTVWPEFRQFVADMEGASVVPCGWFTALGAGLPGFTGSGGSHGDGPCTLPGGGTTTNASAFREYIATQPPTLFDSIIAMDWSNVYQPEPQVRWNVVGSGPYWLGSVTQGQGYILKANPGYVQPNCANQPGCYPTTGEYPGNVYVFWDQNSVPGVQQYTAGESDVSQSFPTDIHTIRTLAQEGKIGVYTQPTLNVFFEGFSFHFDPVAAQSCSGLTVNIPADFFSFAGMREFFAQAFPYRTFTDVYSAGLAISFSYSAGYVQGVGGAIPQFMGDYYPQNITWPGMNTSAGVWPQVWQDPSTNAAVVGSAAWWWANITHPGSPNYDPEAVACLSGSHCTFPIGSELGAAPFDSAVDLWSQIVKSITGGAIVLTRYDPTFGGCGLLIFGWPAGESPYTTAPVGWLPDYPDPTDYLSAFYAPDGSYTYQSGVNETLVQGKWGNFYNGCSSHAADTYANLLFWASQQPLVPQACQGTAYAVMTGAMNQAARLPEGPLRVLYYNLIEHVANGLVLYVYHTQQIGFGTYAGWIDPSTVDTNPVAPGQLWFFWNGTGVLGY